MSDESRFEKAKRMAAATSDERRLRREAEESERSVAIVTMGHALAGSEAARINNDPDIPYLGPVAKPYE